jgi:hypothetical protein
LLSVEIVAKPGTPTWTQFIEWLQTIIPENVQLVKWPEERPGSNLDTLLLCSYTRDEWWSELPLYTRHGASAKPGELRTLEGQGHDVDLDVLAPVLLEFFSRAARTANLS